MLQTEKKIKIISYPSFSEILIISNMENTFLSLHSDINNVSIQITAFRSRNSCVGIEHMKAMIFLEAIYSSYIKSL